MIELNESKRLSLEELTDYVRNSEPFRSMKITEEEPQPFKQSKKVTYINIAVSNVILQNSSYLTVLASEKSKKALQRSAEIECFK